MSAVLRSPAEEDVATVVGLMSEYAPEPVDADLVRRDWSSPTIEFEHDVRIDDAGYCLVEDLTNGRAWLEVHGRPSRELFDWAEHRGSEKGARLFSGAWSENRGLLATLEERGFGLIRHAHRMELGLDEPLPDAEWPNGISVETLKPGDERTFYEIHQETFEDTWEPIRETYEEWSHWLLDPHEFAPDLWFLALSGDQPAGFAICHPLPTRPELGWVKILGVRRAWRRQGLGRALLLHAFHEFSSRGLRRAGLGVDATSLTGANKLYEQAGMRVAARFDIYEKAVA